MESRFKYAKGHEAGIVLMYRQSPEGSGENFLSGILSGEISEGLDYYGEYAANTDDGGFAIYAGLTGYSGAFSFTMEYRKLDDFVIGSGINEPPAGVKQQTYRVLNRSIHVSNPINEEGYQLDLFYNFGDGTIVNLNHSLARNVFGGKASSFRQYFLEIQSSIGENTEYKGFVDFSQDPFKGEEDRLSMGLYFDFGLNQNVRFLPEVEYQTFVRGDNRVYNFNALLGMNVGKKLFVSALGELTNDPFIIREGSASRLYLGSTIRYKPNFRHTVQLFLGQRRGGPQCSAGVCYEILDFKGIELRWVSRFRVN